MSAPEAYTDAERVEWLAANLSGPLDVRPDDFRRAVDTLIRIERGQARILRLEEQLAIHEATDSLSAAPEPEWLELTADFPLDATPVVVRASDGQEAVGCYDSVAGVFYLHYPGDITHGRVWADVYGPQSEVTHWKPQPSTQS